MYYGFLKLIGCTYLCEAVKFQMEDYKKAVNGYKTMWHRTRRGGKSLGLTVLAVFFSLINFGYRANAGMVVWRCPLGKQMKQARFWFRRNPFVININKADGEIHILNSRAVDISAMTPGNVASLGGAVYIMDEAKKIWTDHKVYAEALESYGIFVEGPIEFTRMISASTGARLTLFHTQFLSGEWDYSLHSYTECHWIPEEKIESERRANPQDPYYVQQEYECVWVARGDSAFRNVYVVDMANKRVTHNEEIFDFGDHPFFPLNWTFPTERKGGVDWNDASGHYLVAGSVDDEAIYVNYERVLTTVGELRPYGDFLKIEVESGPFDMNILNTLEAHKLGVKCTDAYWSESLIAARFRLLCSKMIVIDMVKASFTLKNLEEAITDANKRASQLKKVTTQHGLDALMHMIHTYSQHGRFLTPDEKAYLDRKQDAATEAYLRRRRQTYI